MPVRLMPEPDMRCEGVERRKALLNETTPQRILRRLRSFKCALASASLAIGTPRLPALHRDVYAMPGRALRRAPYRNEARVSQLLAGTRNGPGRSPGTARV